MHMPSGCDGLGIFMAEYPALVSGRADVLRVAAALALDAPLPFRPDAQPTSFGWVDALQDVLAPAFGGRRLQMDQAGDIVAADPPRYHGLEGLLQPRRQMDAHVAVPVAARCFDHPTAGQRHVVTEQPL